MELFLSMIFSSPKDHRFFYDKHILFAYFIFKKTDFGILSSIFPDVNYFDAGSQYCKAHFYYHMPELSVLNLVLIDYITY